MLLRRPSHVIQNIRIIKYIFLISEENLNIPEFLFLISFACQIRWSIAAEKIPRPGFRHFIVFLLFLVHVEQWLNWNKSHHPRAYVNGHGLHVWRFFIHKCTDGKEGYGMCEGRWNNACYDSLSGFRQT